MSLRPVVSAKHPSEPIDTAPANPTMATGRLWDLNSWAAWFVEMAFYILQAHSSTSAKGSHTPAPPQLAAQSSKTHTSASQLASV